MGTSAKRSYWRSENWGGWKWALTVFMGIMILHGLAILLFTRGFLLTRTELSQYSECNSIVESPCFPPNPRSTNGSCWTKPVVSRIVIIVLDALRFDFVAPSSFFAEKKPWMDKLQVLHELASQNRSSTKIFKAVADPPTTSLQRLKGLTTGGLPTFIDVGNSFGAPAIVEDNLMHQLVQNGKRVIMMGDDTWVQLFPHHFVTSYPYPSFNVKDLDTVDHGCITNLFPTLYEEDWDVLIAHFLGVDHAGHIFGVDSNPMIEKLEQYNEIIKKVVGVLESENGPGGLHENTMLLVMGDHGQTVNGDHGGGTAEEVETALFAFSAKTALTPLFTPDDSVTCQLDLHGRRICINTFQQLDFAATVSALLGIPFPFGSIGRVNTELFSLAGGTWNQEKSTNGGDESASESNSWLQNYVNVLCINSWQLNRSGRPSARCWHHARRAPDSSSAETCCHEGHMTHCGGCRRHTRLRWSDMPRLLPFEQRKCSVGRAPGRAQDIGDRTRASAGMKVASCTGCYRYTPPQRATSPCFPWHRTENNRIDSWYLDTIATHHMIGRREFFSKLDSNVRGSIIFGGTFAVESKGVDSVVLIEKIGEHQMLSDVYCILVLRNSIISL